MVNLPTAGVDYHVPFGGRKGLELRPARAGALRGRVLYDGQDGVHRAMSSSSPGGQPWSAPLAAAGCRAT